MPLFCAAINNTSRVPAYKKGQKVDGLCDFLVKTPHIGGGLVGGGCLFGTFSAPEQSTKIGKEDEMVVEISVSFSRTSATPSTAPSTKPHPDSA